MSEKIILGIDPGTTVMGYGLIKVVNNEKINSTHIKEIRSAIKKNLSLIHI